MFTYSNVRQCFAITVLLSGFVPKSATFSSLLTLRTRSLWDLISSCTHKYATSMCSSFPIPVENALSGLCVNGQHWFHCKSRVTHHALNPFASDAPNAAAYSSASALLFAMTFCFRVYAFSVCLPSIITPALNDFRSPCNWSSPRP